jgi:HD-GYP domain-containing protein (c-di-GMP phosphodiesterase class II)/DNA-binding CsgD family transcriptional regulator
MRDTLRAAHEESIHRLCTALEASNPDAPQHISRMSDLCWLIGQELGMSAADCALIRVASPMHDVGIVGVSDWILRKPAALTEPERDEIQRHAEIGYRMLAGSRSTVLEAAATIAWTHHEWYDGSGYPRGLKGSEIPLEGRIAAVADVYDSLTRDRPYRARLEHADAVQVLEMERGKHFDPNVVDPFISALQRQSTHAAVEWTGWGAGRSAVPKDRPPTLTPREREVLQLAADGRSGRDIAGALVLSPGTVKTHFQNIYAKLGAHDRAAAVAAGLRRGIIN